MAINISDIIDFNNKEKCASDSWCNLKDCIYCQNGYCITGPELTFVNYIDTNGKIKPVLICAAFNRR